MPTPGLAFAGTLQSQKRLAQGIAFGDVLDEVIRVVPYLKTVGGGESIEVARVIGVPAIQGLSAFRAVGAAPTTGTPTDSRFSFNFRRIDSLSEDDITLTTANRDPNSVLEGDTSMRTASVLRAMAVALMQGLDTDNSGYLGWENMAAGTNRTDVAVIGATPGRTLETLLVCDDTVKSHSLGNRASAFVTTGLGRRNIEVAAHTLGFTLEYGTVQGIPNEVPHFRARPILASMGLIDDNVADQAPLYAVDFTYVFMVATTGEPASQCIERRQMGLQDTGSHGELQWFHGACVVRHPGALVRGLITTTLSS